MKSPSEKLFAEVICLMFICLYAEPWIISVTKGHFRKSHVKANITKLKIIQKGPQPF